MNYFLVMNPMAGRGENRETYLHLRQTLLRFPADQVVRMDTMRPGDATRFAAAVAKEHGEHAVVIGCGGDGTLHEIVNGLAGSKTAFGVWPFGTGNDFAKKIYGRHWTPTRIEEYFTDRLGLASIDTVNINGKRFLNVMSFGFDTGVAATSKQFSFFGKYSYQAAVVACLFRDKTYRLQFEFEYADAQTHPTSETLDLCMAAICNASYYGNGFCPGPNAKLDDGLLDVCIAAPMRGIEIAALAKRYADGKIEGHPKVQTFQATGGTVRTIDGSPLPINCDGELFSCSSARFSVLPRSQTILLPLCRMQALELTPVRLLDESTPND